MTNHKLKTDKYRRARGGHSRFLNITCAKCDNHLFYYQKDGRGILKRAYLDRIYGSKKYSDLEKSPVNKMPQLICSNCKELIGIPMVYKKEKRFAYRLFAGAVNKKVTTASSIPAG